MIRSEVKTFLLKEFLSEFNTATPVCLSNKPGFFYSTGAATSKQNNKPWVKVYIENSKGYQTSMGSAPNRRWDRFGFFKASVNIPENTGTYSGDILCEEIIDIFLKCFIQDILMNQYLCITLL